MTLTTLVVCLAVTVGWWLDMPVLTALVPGAPPMMPNTAVALAALAVALRLLRREAVSRKARFGALALAGLAFLIGALTLLQYLTGWQLGIDRWLLADPSNPLQLPHPGRPSPRGAITMVLLGGAIIRLASAKQGRHVACQVLALVAAMVPYTALIGYAYEARTLFELVPLIPMALSTAALLLLLSLGVLAVRPTWGPMAVITSAESGGQLIRRLLVPFVIFQLALGWIIMSGARAGFYVPHYAAALIAMSNSLVFGGLVIWSARSINRQEERRQRAEAAARRQEALLRYVVANVPVTLFATDAEGRLLLIEGRSQNDGWALNADAIGQPLQTVLTGHPQLIEAFEGALHGTPRRELLSLDGQAFDIWFEPQVDAALVTGVIAVATDITERMRAQEALSRNHAEMQAIFEATVDGVLLVDEHQRLRGHNQRFVAMWNLSQDEVSAYDAPELFRIIASRVHEHTAIEPERERPSVRGETTRWDEYELRDGRTIEQYAARAVSQDGALYGNVWYFRDVSRRKRLERSLVIQNEQLKALDRLKEDFVNAVTHDLRTPLMTINGYAEFLAEGIASPLDDQNLHFVHEIRKAVFRLERMVNDMLDLARIQAGTFQLACERADLVAVTDNVMASFAPRAKAVGAHLEVAYVGGPALMTLDPARIEQVLSNLIGNALKFVLEGGSVTVRIHRHEQQVCVEVADTGPGIAAEDVPRLFQRFSPLEAGIRKGGTGLGLWISKTIVEAHGGTVGVRSTPGKGSTFWFCLPCPPPSHGPIRPTDRAGV
ncbi:MAG: ATP-binding protein [Candidatus Sericytochromatia bacterium]